MGEVYLAEAYVSLAAVKHNYDWAWLDAEKLYQHAIELNPNCATAHQWYSELLISTGRIDEAKREISQASELDPLSPIIKMQRANFYYYSRDYDHAIYEFQKALELYQISYLHTYTSVSHIPKLTSIKRPSDRCRKLIPLNKVQDILHTWGTSMQYPIIKAKLLKYLIRY